MNHKFIFLLLTLLIPLFAKSPIWKISKNDKTLYIGGTIHFLSKDDYPLPKAFDEAYSKSSKLVFEADLSKLNSPEFQQALLQKMIFTDGQNLTQVLNDETISKLGAFLKSRGIPLAGMLNLKPSMVSLTLTVTELQRLKLADAGVDQIYYKKAVEDKKDLGELETVEQQLQYLVTMGEGNEDEMIQYTIRDLEELPKILKSMKEAWRVGNDSELYSIGIKPFKKDFPGIYKSILIDRNKSWIPQIEEFLKDDSIELILVGALHLIGEDGVIEILKNNGYVVEKL